MGENFVYLERRKEKKEQRGKSDKSYVVLFLQEHDRSFSTDTTQAP